MVMAIRKWCHECAAEVVHHNNECTKCADKRKRVARATWNALTNEEKIDALMRRIERLERSPIKY